MLKKKGNTGGESFFKLSVNAGLFKARSACTSNTLILIKASNQKFPLKKASNTNFHKEFRILLWFLAFESHMMVKTLESLRESKRAQESPLTKYL